MCEVSVFGDFLVRIFLHSVLMGENTDQKNSEYGHFSNSEMFDRVFNTPLKTAVNSEIYQHVNTCLKLTIEVVS